MSELSNKMQTPDGDDREHEAQQPSTGSAWDQQDMPAGNYQQGLPPEQGGYQQNILRLEAISNTGTSHTLQASSSMSTNNRMALHTRVMLDQTTGQDWA
jgi:hypothetical protein